MNDPDTTPASGNTRRGKVDPLRLLKLTGLVLLIIGTISFALLVTLLVAYRDYNIEESRFATMKDLKASARTLVADHLPATATDIHYTINHDTDRISVRFEYDPATSAAASSACRPVAETGAGAKYLCPPFARRTVTLILRHDGTGRYLDFPNGL